MARYILLSIAVSLIAQVQSRDIPLKQSKLGPTYDELLYIIQTRLGETIPPPKHMTPCARAIIGCCNDKVMNEMCSENLKCGAHFFDDNPCENKFIVDALEAARQFYGQFNKYKT